MIWNYIKADKFFPQYCPQIKSYKHKIRGKNGRGNPVEFSPEETKEIWQALQTLTTDLIMFQTMSKPKFPPPFTVRYVPAK